MYSESSKTKDANRSLKALLLIMIICVFFMPFMGNAEGGAGELPYESPPIPTGDAPDTTSSDPENDSLYYN